jgi:hypothetical protein
VFVFVTQSIRIAQILLLSIRKVHKSFSLALPSVLHVTKFWPNEKVSPTQRSTKFHAFRSIKQVTIFIALGSQFRGDTTYSYYPQDITCYGVWVSSVGIKYIQSFVIIWLGCKLWNNDKQMYSIVTSFTCDFSLSVCQVVSELNVSLFLLN